MNLRIALYLALAVAVVNGIALSGLAVFPVLTGAMSWSQAWLTLGLAGAILAVMPSITVLQTAPEMTANQTSQDALVKGWQRPYVMQHRWIVLAYFCFGVGYIVYMTFVIAWLKQMRLSDVFSAALWVLMGCAAMASGWVWRKAMSAWHPYQTFTAATLCTAVGSAIPIFLRDPIALMILTVLVGGSFFMVPGSMTALAKKSLPPLGWAPAMNLFTMIFAIGQALGPVLAGYAADRYGLNTAMLLGAGVLLLSAGLAQLQMVRGLRLT